MHGCAWHGFRLVGAVATAESKTKRGWRERAQRIVRTTVDITVLAAWMLAYAVATALDRARDE
jgi:hypothetical protein